MNASEPWAQWKPLVILVGAILFVGAIGGWARQVAWWVGIAVALSFVLIATSNKNQGG